MKEVLKALVIVAAANSFFISVSQADDTLTQEQARTLVQPFYDFLSGKVKESEVRPSFAEGWLSYSGEEKSQGIDKILKLIDGPIRKRVPDMQWAIKNISITTDNEIVVRGEATGTPLGDQFRGLPSKGKPFKIMSIDVHTVKDGKITKTYHVEDWATAHKQVNADK